MGRSEPPASKGQNDAADTDEILYIIDKEGQRFHGGQRRKGEARRTLEDIPGTKKRVTRAELENPSCSQLDHERARDGGKEVGSQQLRT